MTSDPDLELARSYVESVPRDPLSTRNCVNVCNALIEQHGKHERLLTVLRDRANQYNARPDWSGTSLAREILKLIGDKP